MKSIKTLKTGTDNLKTDDIIILPFQETEDDIDLLIREMREEENLMKENEAMSLVSEIKKINRIRFAKLSRVA